MIAVCVQTACMSKLAEKLSRLIPPGTQSEIAEAVGVGQPAISKYLSGQITPRADVLFRLSREIGVSVDYLLDDEIESPPKELTDGEKRLLRYVRETRINPDDAIARLGITLRVNGGDVEWSEDWIRPERGPTRPKPGQ